MKINMLRLFRFILPFPRKKPFPKERIEIFIGILMAFNFFCALAMMPLTLSLCGWISDHFIPSPGGDWAAYKNLNPHDFVWLATRSLVLTFALWAWGLVLTYRLWELNHNAIKKLSSRWVMRAQAKEAKLSAVHLCPPPTYLPHYRRMRRDRKE